MVTPGAPGSLVGNVFADRLERSLEVPREISAARPRLFSSVAEVANDLQREFAALPAAVVTDVVLGLSADGAMSLQSLQESARSELQALMLGRGPDV